MVASGLVLILSFGLAPDSGRVGERAQTLLMTDGSSGVYRLEHNLLVVGTDSVFIDGQALDRSGYVLDYETGTVVFLQRIPAWTLVQVVYRCIRFSGQPAGYRLHELQPAGAVLPETAAAALREPAWEGRGALDVSGMKSLGFSVGGIEGSGINQATQLSVFGEIEGIDIKAELSDQSTPIPPEGTTRELEELDKIVINLRSSNWEGSFGDVELGLPAPGFGTIRRRAVGGLLQAGVGGVDMELGYARPKGDFARVAFTGQDGIQGPYVLAPDGRSAQLVPGSEEVYLDGVRLTRGWDADYTVDYSTGELVFTNRNLIDHRRRIEVAFQCVTEEYDRDDIAGGVSVGSGPASFGVGLFREGDDPAHRFAGELTPEQEDSLGAIGGDTALAWLEGGSYVGDGNGDYVQEGGHYRYVGQDSGDYQVQFTPVGDSLGEYVYDDTLLVHRYVGEQLGDYVARVRVALPERRELVHARVGFDKGALSAVASGVFHRRLRNLFAADGAPVQDGGLNVSLGVDDEQFSAAYRGRVQGSRFEFPGADSAVDFARRWGGVEPDEYRYVNELTAYGRPSDIVELTGEAGMLETDDGSAVARCLGSTRLAWFEGEAERAGDEGRLSVAAAPRVGWFQPRVGWSREYLPGERKTVVSGGLGLRVSEDATGSIEYQDYRGLAGDTATGRLEPAENGALIQTDLAWSSGDAFRVRARVARQNRCYVSGSQQDWTHWLGDLSAAAVPLAGVRLQADLGQSHRLVQLRDEVFRFVGPGQGDYSRDTLTGRYYFDPGGEYERTLVAKGEFTGARERSLNATAEVASFRPFVLTGSFSQVSAATDTALIRDLLLFDTRLTVRALEPWLTSYLGSSGSSSTDRTLVVTGKSSNRTRHYLELFSARMPELELRLRGQVAFEERWFDAGRRDHVESGWRVEFDPVVGRRLRLDLSLGIDYREIEEPVSHPELGRFSLLAKEVGLGRTFSFGRQTRVAVKVDLVQRTASVAELPFSVGLASPLGWGYGCGLDLTHVISDILTASVRYSFDNRPDRAGEHQLAGDLRAHF